MSTKDDGGVAVGPRADRADGPRQQDPAPWSYEAVEVDHDPARLVLAQVVPRLVERGWLGDAELVEEFERVASGEVGRLRPIPVDLEELAHELDGPADFDEGWVLEVATGRLWPRDPPGMAGIDEPEDFEDPDAFVAIEALGSGPGYLGVAIQGKGRSGGSRTRCPRTRSGGERG